MNIFKSLCISTVIITITASFNIGSSSNLSPANRLTHNSASVYSLQTGKPSGIKENIDYYRLGMDAYYKKNYKTAAENLRLAYYKSPTSYNFFWYMNILSSGQFYREITEEIKNAPEEHRYNEHYGVKTVTIAAEALKRLERHNEGVELLIRAFYNSPYKKNDAADILLSNSGLDLAYYSFFSKRDDYYKILSDIIADSRTDYRANKALTKNIYSALLIDSAALALKGKGDEAKKLIDEAGIIMNQCGVLDRIESPENYKIFRDAVYYYTSARSSNKPPYQFRYLLLFIDKIDAEKTQGKKKIRVRETLSDYFVKNKINEMNRVNDAAKLLYYYFSDGSIELNVDIIRSNGILSNLDYSGSVVNINQDSLAPFPADVMFDNYHSFDGFGFFYPAVAGMQYLGGGGRSTIVPYLWHSHKNEFTLKLISGASLSVVIHEVFHGFESHYKISPAHFYDTPNRDKWPEWYAKTVKDNYDMVAEWAYYKNIFTERINTVNVKFPAESKKLADKNLYNKIQALSKKYPESRHRGAYQKITEGRKFITASKNKEALKSFLDALKLIPDHPIALAETGLLYQWRFNKQEEAQPYYERYLSLYPGHEFTFTLTNYVCIYHLNRGEHDLVIRAADRALPFMFSPYDYYHTLIMKAKSLLRKGMKNEAESILRKGADDPENPIRNEYFELLNY